jgi:hypothetical protein
MFWFLFILSACLVAVGIIATLLPERIGLLWRAFGVFLILGGGLIAYGLETQCRGYGYEVVIRCSL